MPSEAEKYWQYSRECTRQALEAETAQQRDQLLGLAKVWTEAALYEEMSAKAHTSKVRTKVGAGRRSVRHGSDFKVPSP